MNGSPMPKFAFVHSFVWGLRNRYVRCIIFIHDNFTLRLLLLQEAYKFLTLFLLACPYGNV